MLGVVVFICDAIVFVGDPPCVLSCIVFLRNSRTVRTSRTVRLYSLQDLVPTAPADVPDSQEMWDSQTKFILYRLLETV